MSTRTASYRLTRFLCSANARLSLALGGGILQGIQEHSPITLIQHECFVFLDHLVGRIQRLAEHEFRQALVDIGGCSLQSLLGKRIEADVHAFLFDGFCFGHGSICNQWRNCTPDMRTIIGGGCLVGSTP